MAETADPEIGALFEIVRQRYAARLTPEQLDALRKIVGGQVEAARALRAIRLTNADEPFQRFAAYRADEHIGTGPLGTGPLGTGPLGTGPLTLPSPQRGEGKS